jgi:hypothetical protein
LSVLSVGRPASGKLVAMIVDARQVGAKDARAEAARRPSAAVVRRPSVIAAPLWSVEALRLTGP